MDERMNDDENIEGAIEDDEDKEGDDDDETVNEQNNENDIVKPDVVGDGDGESGKTRKVRKTKRQKRKDEKDKTKEKFNAAIAAYKAGEFSSINACAVAFGINQSTLSKYVRSGKTYIGKGKVSKVFSYEEERKIIDFVKARVEFGVGLDFRQLCQVIQFIMGCSHMT